MSEYQIQTDESANLAIITLQGKVVIEDIVEINHLLYTSEIYAKIEKELWDLTHASITDMDAGDLLSLVLDNRDNRILNRNITHVAFVVVGSSNQQVIDEYIILSKEDPVEHCAFDALEAAKDWLLQAS